MAKINTVRSICSRALILQVILVFGVICSIRADPPRTKLKGRPLINGKEIQELAVLAPIQVGKKLPPGLPTTIIYELRPNRFLPVCEDAEGVYYQAVGAFQNVVSTSEPGGLYVTKKAPVWIIPYTGEANQLRIELFFGDSLTASDLAKLKVRVVSSKKKK